MKPYIPSLHDDAMQSRCLRHCSLQHHCSYYHNLASLSRRHDVATHIVATTHINHRPHLDPCRLFPSSSPNEGRATTATVQPMTLNIVILFGLFSLFLFFFLPLFSLHMPPSSLSLVSTGQRSRRCHWRRTIIA